MLNVLHFDIEGFKARVAALSPEERRALARSVCQAVDHAAFNVVAVSKMAQSQGRAMPTASEFCSAVQDGLAGPPQGLAS